MSTIQQMTKKENLMFSPNNISEIIKFAEYIKTSALLPAKFANRPADIVLGVLVCLRLGLDPIMGLHQLTVVNGKIVMSTDAMIALVKGHPDCEDIQETFDEATMTATCTIKRKGQSPLVRTFSQQDAKKAGLWNKERSPWVTYPTRMLQMRARGFALRDSFADALNGILPKEEVEDYQHLDKPKSITPVAQPAKKIEITKSKPIEIAVSEMEITKPKQTQEIVEAHVVIDETPLEKKLKTMEQEMKDYTTQNILKGLIEQRNVPSDLVAKWLKRESVDDVINLSDYAANKCLEYINANY